VEWTQEPVRRLANFELLVQILQALQQVLAP
jgi:hypothetical protein